MRFVLAAAASSILFVGSTPVFASTCGDRIAALEKQLNTNGASPTGNGTSTANARTTKSRQVIEDAKAADQRGDAKACDATLEKAARETGSAQQ